jgi:hypothetical protein
VLVGVEEEHHERQVVVELKQAQVRVVDARQPNPDELIAEVFNAVKTNNLLVEIPAVTSGDAAEGDHQGLAGLPGQLAGLAVAGQPAAAGHLARRRPAPAAGRPAPLPFLGRYRPTRPQRHRRRDQTAAQLAHELLRSQKSRALPRAGAHGGPLTPPA